MATALPSIEMEQESKCPICLECLTDPVVLNCGHSFCHTCITNYCDKWETLGALECPVCKFKFQKGDFCRNWQLANLVEKIKLMPLNSGKEDLCLKHKEKLHFFCKEDEKLVCFVCERSLEHQGHTILILEEAAQQQKGNLKVLEANGGDPIPKSPFTVGVAAPLDLSKIKINGLENRVEVGKDQEFLIDIKGAGGQGKLDVAIYGPSQKAVPCLVEPAVGKERSTAKYIPQEEGIYIVDVSYDGIPLPGSPYTVEATLPPDPSKVRAYGPGLQGGLVGKPAEFTIDIKEAGTGCLGLTVEGPCEVKLEYSDNGDGTCSVSYLPTKPGEYLVHILFEEVHIPGSPFKADVEIPFDASKVVATGPGLELGKVGKAGLLNVDCSEAGPGKLDVEAVPDSGSKPDVEVQDKKDGTYAVTYVPRSAGMHTLQMKYNGEPVPNFPARVKVDPAADTSKIKVFGPGIEGKDVFHEATTDFTVDARPLTKTGGDHIGAQIINPSGASTDCLIKDNADGTYAVEFTPYERGPHTVEVTYDDVPIPNSPFSVDVTEGCHPSRVLAEGTGLKEAFTNKPNPFTVVTRGAGLGGLGITVEGPSETEISCTDNKDGSCSAEFVPYAPGDYDVNITYGGENIPGSPFKVPVKDVVDTYKVKVAGPDDSRRRSQLKLGSAADLLDIIESDLSLFTASIKAPSGHDEPCLLKRLPNNHIGISFMPREVGEHWMSIIKNGIHVPNSSVSIMVVQSDIGDASRARVSGRGLIEGRTFEMCDFIVDTRDAGYGGILLAVEGPSEVDIQTEDLDDGINRVSYFPTVPGVYTVSTKFANEHIPGSPFTVKISGEGRVKESITRTQRAPSVETVGSL